MSWSATAWSRSNCSSGKGVSGKLNRFFRGCGLSRGSGHDRNGARHRHCPQRGILRRQTPRAKQVMEGALSFAEAEGYVRPFLKYAATIFPLLSDMKAADLSLRQFLQLKTVMAACTIDKKGLVGATTRFQKDRSKALTEREVELLKLMAAGHRYQEIARRMFISPETVKTHVKHIRKLEVTTKTQAIRRAQDLRLLGERPIQPSVRPATPRPSTTPRKGSLCGICAATTQWCICQAQTSGKSLGRIGRRRRPDGKHQVWKVHNHESHSPSQYPGSPGSSRATARQRIPGRMKEAGRRAILASGRSARVPDAVRRCQASGHP